MFQIPPQASRQCEIGKRPCPQRPRTGQLAIATAAVATLLAAEPAGAALQYSGQARGSGIAGNALSVPLGPQPVQASYSACRSNQCYDFAIESLPGGLLAQSRFDGPRVQNIERVDAFAEATQFGQMTLTSDTPGTVTSIPVTVTLRLAGSLTLDLGLQTSGWTRVQLHVGAGPSSADYFDYRSSGGAPADSESRNAVRVGPDTVRASLMLPIGSFNWITYLVASNHVFSQFGQYAVDARYTASFIEGAPVFDLPAGYHLSSADFGIVDNRFCPNGCSPVPEPSSAWLLAGGTLGVFAVRRRRHPPTTQDRSHA